MMRVILKRNFKKQFLLVLIFIVGITLPFFILSFAMENTASELIKNEMGIHRYLDARISIPLGSEERTETMAFKDNQKYDSSIVRYSLVTDLESKNNFMQNPSNISSSQFNTSLFCLGMNPEYLDYLSSIFWPGKGKLSIVNNNIYISEILASRLSIKVNDSIEFTFFMEKIINGSTVHTNYTIIQRVADILPFIFGNSTRNFESAFMQFYLNALGDIVFMDYNTLKSIIPDLRSSYYINYRKSSYSTTSMISYIQFLGSLSSIDGIGYVTIHLKTTNITPIISNKFDAYSLLLISYFLIFFFLVRKFIDSLLDEENLDLFLYNIKGYSRGTIYKHNLLYIIPPVICGITAAMVLTMTIGFVFFPITSKALFFDFDVTYLSDSFMFWASFLAIFFVILSWRVKLKLAETSTLSSFKAEINENRDMKWTSLDTVLLIIGLSGIILLILATILQFADNTAGLISLIQDILVPLLPFFPVSLSYASLKIILLIKNQRDKRAFPGKNIRSLMKDIRSLLTTQNHKFYRRDFFVFTILTSLLFSSSFFLISSSISFQNTINSTAINNLRTDYLIYTNNPQELINGIPRLQSLDIAPMFDSIIIMIYGERWMINAIDDNFTRTCYLVDTYFKSLESTKSPTNLTLNDHEILILESFAKQYGLTLGSELNFGVVSADTAFSETPVVIYNGTYTVAGIYYDNCFPYLVMTGCIMGSYDFFNSIRITLDNDSEWHGEIFINLGSPSVKEINRDALTADLKEYILLDHHYERAYDILSIMELLEDQSSSHFYMIGGYISILLILIALIYHNFMFYNKRAKEFSFYSSRGFNTRFVEAIVKKELQEPTSIGILSGIALGIINSVVYLSVSRESILQGNLEALAGVFNYYPYLILGLVFLTTLFIQQLTIVLYFKRNRHMSQYTKREII